LGCRATPATTASCADATSRAQRAPGRSQPICTIRGTPTAAAVASASSMESGASPSRVMSRWQWLSTTGCGSGSGRGGRDEGCRDGQGMPVLGGRGKGDMFVSVSVMTPTSLSREQRKLLEQLAKIETKDLEDKKLVDKVRDIFG